MPNKPSSGPHRARSRSASPDLHSESLRHRFTRSSSASTTTNTTMPTTPFTNSDDDEATDTDTETEAEFESGIDNESWLCTPAPSTPVNQPFTPGPPTPVNRIAIPEPQASDLISCSHDLDMSDWDSMQRAPAPTFTIPNTAAVHANALIELSIPQRQSPQSPTSIYQSPSQHADLIDLTLDVEEGETFHTPISASEFLLNLDLDLTIDHPHSHNPPTPPPTLLTPTPNDTISRLESDLASARTRIHKLENSRADEAHELSTALCELENLRAEIIAERANLARAVERIEKLEESERHERLKRITVQQREYAQRATLVKAERELRRYRALEKEMERRTFGGRG
ncbi:hypothetical protein BJY04DRAFT_219053 [Aspergillus karnatakaensis]|uniref:uncharacterized protein n=1 Tax=Aspergillus karnatakaensis TaxID=1810916 RepID=UPI003CCD9D79